MTGQALLNLAISIKSFLGSCTHTAWEGRPKWQHKYSKSVISALYIQMDKASTIWGWYVDIFDSLLRQCYVKGTKKTSFLNLLPNWRALSRCSGSAGKKLWNAITSELDEIFSICKLYITQKESSCTMMQILVMNDLDLVFKGQGCAKKQLNYIILLKTSQK